MSYRQAEELGYVPETEGAGWNDWIDDLIAGAAGSGPKTVTIDGPQGYGLYTVDYTDPANPKILGFVGSTVKPSTGSAPQVNVATGGAHFSTFYGPQGYGTYETSTGTPILINLAPQSQPASLNNDLNGDGFDDQTGLPVGVNNLGKDENGVPLLYYQGIRVGPTGAAYRGPGDFGLGGGSSGLSKGDIIMVGGNPYYLKDGVLTPVPGGPSGPGSTPGSSGNNISGILGSILSSAGLTSKMTSSAPSIASTYGAGAGGGADAGTRLVTGPGGSWQLIDLNSGGVISQGSTPATAPTAQPLSAAEAAQLDIARQRLALDQQSQQFNQGITRQQQQQSLANDFRTALQDVNPNAVRDWLYGHNMPVDEAHGGTIWNALTGGGDALNADTVTGAAALLAQIRGQSGGGLGAGGGLPPGTAGGGGVSPVTGGVAAGGSSAPGAPAPSSNFLGPEGAGRGAYTETPPTAPTAPAPYSTITYSTGGSNASPGTRALLVKNGPDGQPLKDANGNYYLYDPNDPLGQGIKRTTGPNGESLVRWNGTGYDAGNSQALMVNASGQPVDAQGNIIQSDLYRALIDQYANTLGSHGGLLANTYTGNATGLYSFQQYDKNGNTVYGGGYQSIDPSAYGYLAPGATYNPGASGPTGGLAAAAPTSNTASYANMPTATGTTLGTPGTSGLTTDILSAGGHLDPSTGIWIGKIPAQPVQKMATGGVAQGPYISGDSRNGRPNPELNVPTPMGMQVIRVADLPGGLREALNRIPHHATGTYDPNNPNAAPISAAPQPAPVATGPNTVNTGATGTTAAPTVQGANAPATTNTAPISYGRDNVLNGGYIRPPTTTTGQPIVGPTVPGYTGGPLTQPNPQPYYAPPINPVITPNPSPYVAPPVNPVIPPTSGGFALGPGHGPPVDTGGWDGTTLGASLPGGGVASAPVRLGDPTSPGWAYSGTGGLGALDRSGTTGTDGGTTVGASPTTGGQISVPTAGGGTTTITPDQQSLIDEILNQRRSSYVPDMNYLDVAWANKLPSLQAADLAALQERYGVNANDILAERQKYAIQGYRRAGLAGGLRR